MQITYSGMFQKFVNLIKTYCFNVNDAGGYKSVPAGYTQSKTTGMTTYTHTMNVSLNMPSAYSTEVVEMRLQQQFNSLGINVGSTVARTPKEANYFINTMALIMWNNIKLCPAYFKDESTVLEGDEVSINDVPVILEPFFINSTTSGSSRTYNNYVQRRDIDITYDVLYSRFSSTPIDAPTGGVTMSFTSCSSSSSCSSSCSSSSCSSSSSSSSCSSIFIAYFNLP